MDDSNQTQSDSDDIEDSQAFSPMALISILLGGVGLFSGRSLGFLFFAAMGVLLSVFALLFARRWALSSISRYMAMIGLATSIFGITYTIAIRRAEQAELSNFASEQAQAYLSILKSGDYEKAFRLSLDQNDLTSETEKFTSTDGSASQSMEPFVEDPVIQMLMEKKDASWLPTGDVQFDSLESADRYTVDFVDERVASKRVLQVRMVREYPDKELLDGKRAYYWHVDSVSWQQ